MRRAAQLSPSWPSFEQVGFPLPPRALPVADRSLGSGCPVVSIGVANLGGALGHRTTPKGQPLNATRVSRRASASLQLQLQNRAALFLLRSSRRFLFWQSFSLLLSDPFTDGSVLRQA